VPGITWHSPCKIYPGQVAAGSAVGCQTASHEHCAHTGTELRIITVMSTQWLKRPNLAREITITLVVKVMVIYALWLVFFSQPVDDTLTGSEVAKTFLNATEDAPVSGASLNTKPKIETEGESR
jgi:hypothetical protein